ncbi:hypothetical protein B0H17DRAFT_991779 [Mycena rosella]|uniref:Uncharacterized protein n=1 Tax=Mycena rosella TaxID=1033263 RepID=A0AAD7G5Q1_MYCRO|nr:hypothetical protein B0H17DRAFT_991779 [Mycena rosella]
MSTKFSMAIAILLPLMLANAARMLLLTPFNAAGVSPKLNVGPLNEVLMDVHNTVSYELNGTQADAQWAALIPAYGGIVRLGPERTPFMLSMYHQLRCLDVLRRDYVAGSMGKPNTSPATRHCLNYIRQMVLCRGDRRLESVIDPYGQHAVQVRGTQTCRDWSQVYDFVSNNEEWT